MGSAGALVTGVEPAGRLIEYARRLEVSQPLGIRYLQRDLSRLGTIEGPNFDAVVANMVLLDIADWQAAVANCLRVLRAGGQFIFSFLHPCWAPDAVVTWADHRRVELTEYLQPYEVRTPFGVNFHRPLSDYLNYALRLGASINEIAEPAPPDDLPDGGLADVAVHIPNYVVVSVSPGVLAPTL
jgi:SAM-dependent methyltransferase